MTGGAGRVPVSKATGVLEGRQPGNPRPRICQGGIPHLVSREGIPHNHLSILEREETTVEEGGTCQCVLTSNGPEVLRALCPDGQQGEAAEIQGDQDPPTFM